MSSGEEGKEEEHIVVARMGHWYKGELAQFSLCSLVEKLCSSAC